MSSSMRVLMSTALASGEYSCGGRTPRSDRFKSMEINDELTVWQRRLAAHACVWNHGLVTETQTRAPHHTQTHTSHTLSHIPCLSLSHTQEELGEPPVATVYEWTWTAAGYKYVCGCGCACVRARAHVWALPVCNSYKHSLIPHPKLAPLQVGAQGR